VVRDSPTTCHPTQDETVVLAFMKARFLTP
jgi:hypothetical protein